MSLCSLLYKIDIIMPVFLMKISSFSSLRPIQEDLTVSCLVLQQLEAMN